MSALPALFLSHGAPTLALEDSATGRFLDALATRLPRPRAIVVASAHFHAARPTFSGAEWPGTTHDFGGFPEPLYRLQYPAPGAPALAREAVALLGAAGIEAAIDPTRAFDHGVWVPLQRAYRAADIPVLSLSVDPRGDARNHYFVGRALAPLREHDVLIVGSGGYTHNLGALRWDAREDTVAPFARAFTEWFDARLAEADTEALLDWMSRAPAARMNHPSVEHFMPLFVALGAAGDTWRAEHWHRAMAFGSLALDAYAFRGVDEA